MLKGFLEDGNKVRAYVFFRGRSILFKEQGEVLLLRFANDLEEYGKVEQMPALKGRKCSYIFRLRRAGRQRRASRNATEKPAEAQEKLVQDAEQAEKIEKNSVLANAKGGDALKKLKENEENA